MTDPHPPDEGAPSTDPADGEAQPPDDATAGQPDPAEVDDAAEPTDPATGEPSANPATGDAAGRPDVLEVDDAPEPPAQSAAEQDPEAAGQPDETSEVDVPGESGGLLPPSRRTLALSAAAVLVVAAVVVTLIVTIPGEDDRPVPSGTMPTLASQFAVPPSGSPSQKPPVAASLPAFEGSPLWTVPLPAKTEDQDIPDFAVSDHGYVFQRDEEVLGLDRAGTQLWRYTAPEVDHLTVRVTGPQVLVGYSNPDEDRWPQPDVIIALDAATGKELWRETEASLWSATTDTVYMSVCYGGQNNRIGDCRMSARDPGTNAIRWTVPTYASSRVVNDSRSIQTAPNPPHLLVEAYRTGADTPFVSAHDPRTGAVRGSGYEGPDERIGQIDVPTERSVVTVDDRDENPADGCQATVTGFSVSGAENWRQTVRTGKEQDGRRCGQLLVSYNRGRMGITAKNGAPGVLNLDTGAIEWSAPAKGEAVAATDTTLLVVESPEDDAATRELVAYRVGNAKPVWRAPVPAEAELDSVTVTGARAVFTGFASEAAGYDLKSGKAWAYGGPVAQATAEWFAVCSGSSCRGYAIG